ncbi:MAG: hypothetical protein KAH07_10385, partial [Flavobacteriaceae bacterium]|nr:hypothetical protein [Flavobacteriaceae bacterium]
MKNLFSILMLLATLAISAQDFDMSAEVRPRYENKHGQKTLLEPDANGTNFVSQRTRLNFNFAHNKIRLGVSAQNVRVWGDVSTLSSDDRATSLHVAWAEALLTENFSIVFGRQEIVYDDSRIFGNVGWAQQARSHDAMIAKWKFSEKSKLDLGVALNSDNQSNIDALYSGVAGYKTFQYAWYHTSFDKLDLSLLALNNGVEFVNMDSENEISYSQTLGSRLNFKGGKFAADASFYFQTGKINTNSVNSSYFGGNISFKPSSEFKIGLGAEYLSGKDMDDASSDVKSFNPL